MIKPRWLRHSIAIFLIIGTVGIPICFIQYSIAPNAILGFAFLIGLVILIMSIVGLGTGE